VLSQRWPRIKFLGLPALRPSLLFGNAPVGIRTRDLSITSPTPYHYTIPSQLYSSLPQISPCSPGISYRILAAKSEGVRLIARMITNVTDRRTDDMRSQDRAVHCAVKSASWLRECTGYKVISGVVKMAETLSRCCWACCRCEKVTWYMTSSWTQHGRRYSP